MEGVEIWNNLGFAGATYTTLSPVPEPSEWMGIGFGVLGVVYVAKRRFMPVAK